mmetsp:Transcript_9900/g.14655  ORF Transcript_9900/g.14655 Transcript_9900/m.14655 type:complete len:612 (+) Transcript_9900:145-1980(+)
MNLVIAIAGLVAPFLIINESNTQTKTINSNFTPPKMGDAAEENEIGLALAGGSIRAASSCYGVLRGFQQKRLKSSSGQDVSAMDLVKYNSGISGGTIPSILYTYAGVPVEELLEIDRTTDPSKITVEELSRMPKTSMGYVLARKPDGNKILALSVLKVLTNPLNIFRIHSLWTAILHKKFCMPLKIPKNKFFTSSKDELQDILNRNPRLKESDFLLPRDDIKAFPMILVSMLGTRADRNVYEANYRKIVEKAWEVYNVQESSGKNPDMTEIILSIRGQYGSDLPMPYVITPDCVENKYHGEVQIRNKKIDFPEKNVRPFEWGAKDGKYGRKRRFSVEFLAGMSTNFVGSAGVNKGKSTLALFLTGLRKISFNDDLSSTQRFADGGSNDLMGLIPLVDRGTKNIISVYNFNQNPPSSNFTTTYADIYKAAPCTSMDDPDFDKHFKTWLTYINPRFTCFFGFFGHGPINHANIINHIFNDPNIDHLKELMMKYNSLFEAGEPLIATLNDLEVIDNPFWGVKGGKTVNLTLMWFNLPEKFSSQIPKDAAEFTSEEFKNVPELLVDGTDALKYSQPQVNMMGYLGSWMVDHSWDGLKGLDGEVLFEGFAKIFGEK